MHHHPHQGTAKVLNWACAATLLFVAFEWFAGIRYGSLALVSDAGHNLTDAVSLALAAFGLYVEAKPADDVKTFGYRRAGVLAAFVNALGLIVLALWIFWEAWHRLMNPVEVQPWPMLIVAAAALVLNLAIMLGLHRDKSDLNIRAAYLHMLGDALSSIALVAGAVAIRYTGWRRIDPLLSVLIGALIVWTAWDIIKESLNVLLEGLPRGIELKSVVDGMRQVEGVIDVHDLHIWSLGSEAHALSCHALIEDMPPSSSDSILKRLNEVLCTFGIHHATVQFEHVKCALSDSPCSMPVGAHAHHH